MRLPSLDRVHIVCSRIPFVTVVSQAPSQSSSSTRSFWCPVPPTPKETRCANNPGERSAQTDAGTRHHCTAPPTDQAVPPGNWSLDQGTPQRGRHGHRAIHRPALLRGTAGRPVARPTRRKGIKARGRSLTPARGGYGGNDGYAGEPIEREQSDVPFLRTRRVERRRIPSRRRLRLRPHQTGQLASQPLPRSTQPRSTPGADEGRRATVVGCAAALYLPFSGSPP